MTYLRPALAKFRFRKAVDSGLKPESLALELTRLATVGGCAPKDLAAFLDELGAPGSAWSESIPELRRSIADSVVEQVRSSGWKSLATAGESTGELLSRETEALKTLGGNRQADTKEVFLYAVIGAKTLEPLPNALALAETLDLSAEDKTQFKARVCTLLTDGRLVLPQGGVAALAKGDLCDGDEFLPARIKGIALSTSRTFGERAATAFAAKIGADLQRVKGLHYTQQRQLTQLETYNNAVRNYTPEHDFIALAAARYTPGNTSKGRERETRAFFAVLGEAAHLLRDRQAGDKQAAKRMTELAAALQAPRTTLRDIRSSRLAELAEHRATRLGTIFARHTGRPARSFSSGLRIASPVTVDVAHDLSISSRALDSYSNEECVKERPRKALASAMSAFADGRFSEWKYSHELADHQLAHLFGSVRESWKSDHAWELPFEGPGGTRLRARESSDIRELLYFADKPVTSCASLLSDGVNGFTGVSVMVDANKKVVFIEDDRGSIIGRTVIRTGYDPDGEALVVVEPAYSSSNDTRFENMLQAGVVAGLATKYDGAIEISAGISMTDDEQVRPANDVLGLSTVYEHSHVVIPASLAGYEYVDSCMQVDSIIPSDPQNPKHMTLQSAILRNADQAKRLPFVASTTVSASPLGAEEKFSTRTQAKLSLSDRVLARLFPNRDERAAFTNENPDCLPTGDIPSGTEESWRSIITQSPKAAQFLHHVEFATSVLRGHPDPKKGGEDFRTAVAIAEVQPVFSSIIGGLSRKEIGALRDSWRLAITEQVRTGPEGVWPPHVNLRPLIGALAPNMAARVAIPFETERQRLRPLSTPTVSLEPSSR